VNIKLTQFNSYDNYIKGVIGDYSFQAKHFDVGSEYGINEGRTSKLAVWKGKEYSQSDVIVNYDRGWDIEPETEEQKEVCDTLVDYLEQLPQRFNELENEPEITL
jgi:hypothetical protein